MRFLDGNSEVLESLVNEMYARGLSTRDVEDAFRDATGELLISKSAVSEITDRLWEDYQAFISRDLSGIEVEYLFVDAVFESLRRHGAKEALLVGWCIASDGAQAPAAPGRGQQGVRSLLDRVLPLDAQPRAADADHHHHRRRAGAGQGDRGRVSPPRSGSAVGSTGWPTSAPSCPTRPPRR